MRHVESVKSTVILYIGCNANHSDRDLYIVSFDLDYSKSLYISFYWVHKWCQVFFCSILVVFSEISKNIKGFLIYSTVPLCVWTVRLSPVALLDHVQLVSIWNFSISDFFSCLFQCVSAASSQWIKKPLAELFSLPVDSKWSLPSAWWIEFPVSKACDFKENNEQRPKNPLSDFIMRERF